MLGARTFDLNVATSFGKTTFVYMVVRTWNDIQKEMKGVMLRTSLLVKLKSLLVEFPLNIKILKLHVAPNLLIFFIICHSPK